MARQTPQQKRANAGYAKTIEKQMGRPTSAYKKKDMPRSPISTPMLSMYTPFLAFHAVFASTNYANSPARFRGGRNTGSGLHRDWRCNLGGNSKLTSELGIVVKIRLQSSLVLYCQAMWK